MAAHRAAPGVTLFSMLHKHLESNFCLVRPDEWSPAIIRGRDETADQGLHNDTAPGGSELINKVQLPMSQIMYLDVTAEHTEVLGVQ